MGAPKGTGRFSANPLQVSVTHALEERIATIAKRDNVSKASVVRDIINAGIEAREQEKPHGNSNE